MQFTIVRSNALRILTQAYKTCSKDKDSIDSNFLFQEKSGNITVTAINESAQQNVVFPVRNLKTETGEMFSIPAQSLIDILRQFPEEDMNCRYQESESVLLLSGTTKNSKIILRCSESEEYIPFSFTPSQKTIVQLPGAEFASSLRKTAQFAHNDSRRGAVHCVHLTASGTILKTEACDDTQMAVMLTQIEDIGENSLELMLFKPAADSLSKMIDGIKEITIEPGINLARFTWEDTELISRLGSTGDKEFLDFQYILQLPLKAKLKIARNELVRAIKLAVLMAKDSYIELAAGEDGLSVIVRAGANGAGQDVVHAIEHEGEATAFMAARPFLNAVENLEDTHVTIEFREQTNGKVCGCLLIDKNFKHYLFPTQPN